jgi:hypothetical protein
MTTTTVQRYGSAVAAGLDRIALDIGLRPTHGIAKKVETMFINRKPPRVGLPRAKKIVPATLQVAAGLMCSSDLARRGQRRSISTTSFMDLQRRVTELAATPSSPRSSRRKAQPRRTC